MGTSASSMGPGAGVSLDPEWLDDIELSIISTVVLPTTEIIEPFCIAQDQVLLILP